MDLLKSYDKNKKKHLLKEVTATGAAGTFVGGAGDYIDQKFAGPFHPELNNEPIDEEVLKEDKDIIALAGLDNQVIEDRVYSLEEFTKNFLKGEK